MKRRLQRAYDHMTMPDSCSQRIEEALQREMRKQKNMPKLPKDAHTRIISPGRKKGNPWGIAAAAVLLVLVVSVGGVGLMIHAPAPAQTDPAKDTQPSMTEMIVPTQETTPEDYYSVTTDLPASAVDAVAEEIRQAVLEEDWFTLCTYLRNGYQGGDLPIDYGTQFADYMELYGLREDFRKAIEEESCRRMFCNVDDGIMMGAEGQIWLNEIDGEVKIVAINDMVPEQPRYEYKQLEDGTICILRYAGNEEEVTIPGTIDEMAVTRLGSTADQGNGVFQGCETVRSVTIPDSITLIDDNAFSGCINLETVIVGPGVTGVGHCAFEACPKLTSVSFCGDAPAGGNYVFMDTEQVTVYYNEPTNGWTDSWEGRPTAVIKRNTYEGSRVFESLFMPLAKGEIGNTEQEFQNAVQTLGYRVIEENGIWLVQDPENGGICMNAKPLYGESGWAIDQAGYSVTTDGYLYHVKVENMISGNRTYATGNSIFAEGGTVVSSPEAFRDYLASKPGGAPIDREAAHEKLARILTGEGTFRVYDGDLTIEEYFRKEMTEGVYGSASHCAVMDLDGNGINEVLLRIMVGENNDVGTLILFSNGSEIRGEETWYRNMYQLKEDGTFFWSGGASDSGIGQMAFADGQPVIQKIHWSMPDSENPDSMTYWKDGGLKSTQEEFNQLLAQQEAKRDVQWMEYPEEIRTAAADVFVVRTASESSDQEAIQKLMEAFGKAYFSGDRAAMESMMESGYQGLLDAHSDWNEVRIVSCKQIPQGTLAVGDRRNVSLEVRIGGQDSYSYLSMSLVKQTDGWRVSGYGLER